MSLPYCGTTSVLWHRSFLFPADLWGVNQPPLGRPWWGPRRILSLNPRFGGQGKAFAATAPHPFGLSVGPKRPTGEESAARYDATEVIAGGEHWEAVQVLHKHGWAAVKTQTSSVAASPTQTHAGFPRIDVEPPVFLLTNFSFFFALAFILGRSPFRS